MKARVLIPFVLVTAALATATWIAWWALPLAAAAYGVLTRDAAGGPLMAGVSGIAAWAVIVVIDSMIGPVSTVAATLGGVLQVRPIAVYAVTLAFPGLMAVSAALVARSLARVMVAPSSRSSTPD